MDESLGICAVYAGAQKRAQRDIERAGFGTRMPSFRVAFDRQGQRQVQVRPLFPGLVFTYLGPGYGVLDDIEGVRVLKNGGQPLIIKGADEDRLGKLELDCLLGEFNKVRFRNVAGRFVAAPITDKLKQKKRRCRSMTARADRRRKRRAKKRGVRNHTNMTNHI